MEAVKEMESVEKIQAINKTSWIQRMKSYKRTPLSFVLWLLVNVAMIATVAVLAYLIVYILVNGVPYLNSQLFELKYTSENASVFPAIINTLIMTVLSLLFAVPLGIFAAIYLVEYAKRGNKLVEIVRLTAETLSGIPSIVYGLFGMLFFVKALGWGLCLLSGAATMAIMILPLIMRTTEEALKSVPDSYREGSFGLGAGKWRVIRTVVLPSCVDGIITGCILSVGRILGESAALLFTAGFAHALNGFFEGLGSSGATLTVALYVYAKEQGEFEVALDNAVQDGRSEIEVSRNGHEYQLNISRIGSDEQKGGVVILVFDISDKVFAERNRKEFTANVSHELKTPLTSLLLNVNTLQTVYLPEENQAALLESMDHKLRWLDTMVRKLLMLLSVKKNAAFSATSVPELLARVQQLTEGICAKYGVSLKTDCRVDMLSMDADLMCSALANLVENSAKASAPGQVVSVSADEIGFTVTEVTEDGFLRFTTEGGVDQRMLLGSVLYG